MSKPVVWGVDVACEHVSIAVILPDDTGYAGSVYLPRGMKGGRRLDALHQDVGELAQSLRTRSRLIAVEPWTPWQEWLPEVVVVELPIGFANSPSLMQACGVTMAALYSATGAIVDTATPTEWKAPGVGHGAAGKELIAQRATERGFEFNNQDEADAFGIAWFAREVAEEYQTGVRPLKKRHGKRKATK